MKMKWLLSVVLAALAAAGIFQINEMYQLYGSKDSYHMQLDKQLKNLEAQERELKRQRDHIEQWNELWKDVQKARVEPGNWFANSVDISRELNWQEMEQLLFFLSSGDPRTTGFWFKPERFRVTRVVHDSAPAPQNGAKRQGPSAPTPAAAEEQMFSISIQGEFLIPKLGGL